MMNNRKIKIEIAILVALIITIVIGVILVLKVPIYKVTFNLDGQEFEIEVRANSKIYKPSDPVKDKNTFDGWYYNGEKFDFNNCITENMVLEARWSSDEKTIEVGTKPKEDDKKEKPQTNKTQTTIQNPTTTNKPSTNKPNTSKPTKPVVKEPVITYSMQNIENSTVKQVAIYVLKDGKPVNGTVTITSKSGKSATVSVPNTGIIKNADAVALVSNPKAN